MLLGKSSGFHYNILILETCLLYLKNIGVFPYSLIGIESGENMVFTE